MPVRQVLAAGLEDGVGRGQALRQAIIVMLELSRKDSACTESPTALLLKRIWSGSAAIAVSDASVGLETADTMQDGKQPGWQIT